MKPGERCTKVAGHKSSQHDHVQGYSADVDWLYYFGTANKRCEYVEPATLPPTAALRVVSPAAGRLRVNGQDVAAGAIAEVGDVIEVAFGPEPDAKPAADPFEMLAKLRAAGWMVAVHNDYRQGGKLMTFWLFTRAGRAVKGEGETDAEALARVMEEIRGRDRE